MKLSELKRICEEATEILITYVPEDGITRKGTIAPSRVKKMIELLELARDFIGTNSIDQMNGYHEVPEAKSWLKTYKSEFENES